MVVWNLYLSCSVYQLDTSWNTIHVDQTWKSSRNKFVCSVKQSVTFKKRRTCTHRWKHRKLFVCTRCCIHWRCSWWSCWSSPRLHHRPACSSPPPSACVLCHVSDRPGPSFFFFFLFQIITPSLRQQLESPCSSSITVKDVLSHREVSWGQ